MLVRFKIACIGVGQAAGSDQAATSCIHSCQPSSEVNVKITVIAVEKHHTGQRRAGCRRHPAQGPTGDERYPRIRHTGPQWHTGIADRSGGAVHIEKPLSMDVLLITGDRLVSGFQ